MTLPKIPLFRIALTAMSALLVAVAGAQMAHANDVVILDPNKQPTIYVPGLVKKDQPTHIVPGNVIIPNKGAQPQSGAKKRRPSADDIRKMLERIRRDKAAQRKRGRTAPAPAPAAPKSSKKKRSGFTIKVGKHKIRVDGKVRVDFGRRAPAPAPRTRYVPAPRTRYVPAPRPRTRVRHGGIVRHGSAAAKKVTLFSPATDELADNGNASGTDGIVWKFLWSSIEGAQAYELVVRAPGSDQDEIQTVTKKPFFKFATKGFVPNELRKGWTYKVRALINGQWTVWTVGSFDVAPVSK